MAPDTKTHRHLIAIPLSLAFAVSIVAADATVSRASISTEQEATKTIQKSSELIRRDGFFTAASTFDLNVSGIDGAVMLLSDDSSSTVVSLIGTVVASAHGKSFILPPGYQLRSDEMKAVRSPVQKEWFEEQRDTALALPQTSSQEVLADTETAQALLGLQQLSKSSSVSVDAEALLKNSIVESDLGFVLPAIASSFLRPMPEALITAWTRDAKRMIAEGSDALVVASELPERYDEAGYPKQAMLWRSAVTSVRQFASDLTVERPVRAQGSSSSSAPEYSSEQLRLLTMTMLQTYGVLFTADSRVTIDGGIARVTGIFVAEDGRDAAYEFSYAPKEEMLSAIVRDGEHLPNSVPVTQFFETIRDLSSR